MKYTKRKFYSSHHEQNRRTGIVHVVKFPFQRGETQAILPRQPNQIGVGPLPMTAHGTKRNIRERLVVRQKSVAGELMTPRKVSKASATVMRGGCSAFFSSFHGRVRKRRNPPCVVGVV